jgi:hypothetical protein
MRQKKVSTLRKQVFTAGKDIFYSGEGTYSIGSPPSAQKVIEAWPSKKGHLTHNVFCFVASSATVDL